MQTLQDGNHGMGHQNMGPPSGQLYAQLYNQLLPVTEHILQVLLENESQGSVHAVVQFIIQFRFQDETTIAQWIPPRGQGLDVQQMQVRDQLMRGKILEAFASWVLLKAKILDDLIPLAAVGYMGEHLQTVKMQLEQACYQSSRPEVTAEFLYAVVLELLGPDAACLGTAIAGMLVSEVNDFTLLDYPSILLAHMVSKLEEIQGKIAKVVMDLYITTKYLENSIEARARVMTFFQHFSVDTSRGTLDVHGGSDDPDFQRSSFRVHLVNSYGSLMRLLVDIEGLASRNSDVAVAVDFEGVKLCRNGQLCLVQLTCSNDPGFVFVLDVHMLGKRAFSMATPNGTSMKGILEGEQIRKVWFDPRNDIDALYHQFGIVPKNFFDLQLAEVAHRRSRGLNVHYVQGLFKCLTQCDALAQDQKSFAEKINTWGKNLFEPLNGGSYEVFRQRPLNPVILVYAAHDTRYMLLLYQQYVNQIGQQWVDRVLNGGHQRIQWCFTDNYVAPSTEAPDF